MENTKVVQFPSMEQVAKIVADRNEKAMKWKELPEMVPYQIEKVTDLSTKYGDARILTLKNQARETTKVWACSGLLKKNIKHELEGRFIVSTGLKQSKTSNNQYYGYLLMNLTYKQTKRKKKNI